VTDQQADPDGKALLTPTKILMQLAGFGVGLALLAWIIYNAIGEGDWGRIARADPRLIAAMLGFTLVSALLNGSTFWITVQPIAPLHFWDLQRLNVVANMLNYAPIRLGAIARVLYHLRMDGLGLLQIGAWFSFIGYTLALGVASCVLATIVHARVDWVWAGLVAVQLLLGAMAIRVAGGLPLVARHGRGIDRMINDHRSLWGAIVLRVTDLGAFTQPGPGPDRGAGAGGARRPAHPVRPRRLPRILRGGGRASAEPARQRRRAQHEPTGPDRECRRGPGVHPPGGAAAALASQAVARRQVKRQFPGVAWVLCTHQIRCIVSSSWVRRTHPTVGRKFHGHPEPKRFPCRFRGIRSLVDRHDDSLPARRPPADDHQLAQRPARH
jgi:hypothetical protein